MAHGEAHRVIQLSLALLWDSAAPAAGRRLFPGRAPWWGQTRAQSFTLLMARTYLSLSSACCLTLLGFFSFPASPFSSLASHPPLQPLLLSLSRWQLKLWQAKSGDDFSQVISSPGKYEQVCRHLGRDAAASWMWDTAPRPHLSVHPSGRK